MREPVDFTLRFFLDSRSGTTYEAGVRVSGWTGEGTPCEFSYWCSCPWWQDEGGCSHVESLEQDELSAGVFFLAIAEEAWDELEENVGWRTTADAARLRSLVLEYGMVEVI